MGNDLQQCGLSVGELARRLRVHVEDAYYAAFDH